MQRFPQRLLLATGLALYVMLAVWVFVVLGGWQNLAGDFAIYLRAAEAAFHGSSPYYPYNIGYSFVYHPAVLSFLTPLRPLGEGGAFALWTIANLAAYGALLVAVFRRWGVWIVTLLVFFAPLIENLLLGQINVFTALALVAAWRFAEAGRDRAAGFALALAIVLKLSPALLLVYFAARRCWELVIFTFIALLVLTGIPLLQFGARPVVEFITVSLETLGGTNTIGANVGLVALLSRAGFPAISLVSRVLLAAGTGILALLAWRRGSAAIFSLLVLVMLELSPLVWLHHFVFFVIILALVHPPARRWHLVVTPALVLVQSERSIAQRLSFPSGLVSLIAVLLMSAMVLAAYAQEAKAENSGATKPESIPLKR